MYKTGEILPFDIKSLGDKEVLFISFSGGQTSAYMVDKLIENYSDKYHFIMV